MKTKHAVRLAQAHKLIGAGDFLAAESILKNLVKNYPKSVDVFHAFAKLYVDSEDFDGALKHARSGRSDGITDELTLKLECIALTGQAKFDEAFPVITAFLARDLRDEDVLACMAVACRGISRIDDAISAYTNAIAVSPSSAKYLGRGICYIQQKRFIEASVDLQKSILERPDNAEAIFYLGVCVANLGNHVDAIKLYERAIKLGYDEKRLLVEMGLSYQKLGEFERAKDIYILALKSGVEQESMVLYNLALVLCAVEEVDGALSSIRRALDIISNDVDARLLLVELLVAKGSYCDARQELSVTSLITGSASEYRAILLQATINAKVGDLAAALNAINSVSQSPHRDSNWAFTMGLVLQERRDFRAAETFYTEAIQLNSQFIEAWNNRAVCLRESRNFDLALKCFEEAEQLFPRNSSIRFNKALLFMQVNNKSAALQELESLVTKGENRRHLLGHIITLKMGLADWSNLDGLIESLRTKLRNNFEAASPHTVVAVFESAEDQLLASSIFSRSFEEFLVREQLKIKRNNNQKINIGYFSADLYDHATSHLFVGVLENHNREKFEISCFSFGRNREDSFSKRVRQSAGQYFDVAALDDIQLVEFARRKNLDIAVDLKGHTLGARPQVFARGVAPVQINYLGFPGSFGGRSMDFIIADHITIPRDHERFFSEKILRTKQSFQPSDDTRPILSFPRESRKVHGLPPDKFVYCSFNAVYKITPKMFSAWCEILRSVPDSVLWIYCDQPGARKNLADQFLLHRIELDRIIFADPMPTAHHRSRIGLGDLALDTFPCGGHTTTNDLLWAGVPVLTLVGEPFASRVGASLLTTLGAVDLVVSDLQSYVGKAVAVGTDKELALALKHRVQSTQGRRDLFDTRKYTADLEALYEEAALSQQR